MSKGGGMMEPYQMMQIGFYVCLAVAVLFLIISTALFFRFDIPTILSVRSGKKKEKAIKEMLAEVKTTGRMRRTKSPVHKDSTAGYQKTVIKQGVVQTPNELDGTVTEVKPVQTDDSVVYDKHHGEAGEETVEPSTLESPTIRLDAVDSAVLVQSATIPEVEGVRFDIVRKTVYSAAEGIKD